MFGAEACPGLESVSFEQPNPNAKSLTATGPFTEFVFHDGPEGIKRVK